MSRRITLAAITLLLFMAIPSLALASSLSQTGGTSPLDNPNIVFAITFGGFLLAVIVMGVIGALVAPLVTRFLGKNVPPDAQMTAFDKQLDTAIAARWAEPRKPIVISPTLEPFVISIGGFLVVFALVSAFVKPPEVKGGAAAGSAPAAPSGLATTGDFTKIVAALPKGNPDNGPKLFTAMGCVGCHSQEKDKRLVGPSFYGLFGRAATRKPNYGAREYIYESIVLPNAYVVDGFQSGLMPQTFAKQLSQQDMADILAWIERDHNEK